VNYLTFSNELHYLWSYLAEVHQIFTRYSHITSDIASSLRTIVQRMQVASVGVHDILPKSIDCHGNETAVSFEPCQLFQ